MTVSTMHRMSIKFRIKPNLSHGSINRQTREKMKLFELDGRATKF